MTNIDDAWEDDRTEFSHYTLPYLQIHGKSIGIEARNGDTLAAKIIANYSRLSRSFDPVTHHLLKECISQHKMEVEGRLDSQGIAKL